MMSPMLQVLVDILEELKAIRRELRPQEPGVSVIGPHPFKQSIRCEVCSQHQTNSIHVPPEGPPQAPWFAGEMRPHPPGTPVWTDGRGNFSPHETLTCHLKMGDMRTAEDVRSHGFSGGIEGSCHVILAGKICGMWAGHPIHIVHGNRPHVFSYRGDGTGHCLYCEHPERHLIHGYTGE